jgi:hypothetical protein
MENCTTLKEILLVADSSLFLKSWLKRNEDSREKSFTPREKIMDACWNGLIPEILPECFNEQDQSLTLWQVNDSHSFIDLEFCAFVQQQEKELSVNPYLFMETQVYN